MPGQHRIPIVLLTLLTAAGCASSALPTLPPAQAPELPKQAGGETSRDAAETVSVVPGNPTDVYALVARGAHRCWFGADGALKATHVFHAEAEPPAKGGAAEIVLHERDETLRDKRGARAFRVTFSAIPAGVRVGVDTPKMERQLAQIMTKDVMTWVKGGGECSLQRPAPPIPPPSAKGKVKPARVR